LDFGKNKENTNKKSVGRNERIRRKDVGGSG